MKLPSIVIAAAHDADNAIASESGDRYCPFVSEHYYNWLGPLVAGNIAVSGSNTFEGRGAVSNAEALSSYENGQRIRDAVLSRSAMDGSNVRPRYTLQPADWIFPDVRAILAAADEDDTLVVTGGAQAFRTFFPIASRLEILLFDEQIDSPAHFFPAYDHLINNVYRIGGVDRMVHPDAVAFTYKRSSRDVKTFV